MAFRLIEILKLKTIPLSLLLLFICCWCSAQTSIVGKWNYAGIRPIDSDPWSQTLIDIMIGKNSYKQFYANNLYTAYENEKETYGRWTLSNDNKKLVTISYDGNVRTFEITRLTNDTLVILGNKKVSGTLVKDTTAGTPFVKDVPQLTEPVRGTVRKISKKWILKATTTASATEEEKMANQIVSTALRSSWYDFKSDGVVFSKFGTLKTLTWYFENKNKSIVIVDDNGDGSLWDIISVTGSQLIIQKPHASTQLIFEADQSE